MPYTPTWFYASLQNLGTTKGRKHNIYLSGTDLIGSSPTSFIHFLKNGMSLSPFHEWQIFHCVAVPVPHLLHPFPSVGSMTELLWLALTLMIKYCCDVLTWRLWGKHPGVAQLSHMEALLLVVRGVAILTYLATGLVTSPPACVGVLSSHPQQLLLIFVFSVTIILIRRRWNLSTILICVSLMASA